MTALALVLALAAPALGQVGEPAISTPTPSVVLSTAPDFGPRIPADKGPWVIGEVLFHGAQSVSGYALNSKVRARRGTLYTAADVQGDISSLLGLGVFTSVEAGVFLTQESVPVEYSGIAVSTSMVRLVYLVAEKPGQSPAVPVSTGTAAPPPVKPEDRVPPAAVSGVVLTPTAWRGLGRHNRPGLGLDFNAVYYIGRLYGKNHLPYTTRKTNYLDRLGQWFLAMDGKMQVQSEAKWRPAVAVGAQTVLSFRDAPQPSITTPGVTVKVNQKATRVLTDLYVVASKKLGPIRSSVGWMQGSFGDSVGSLSEFLTPEALNLGGHPNQAATSKSVFYFSAFGLPKPAYPLGFEFIKPNGMALQPYLINMKLGYFLKLNFDLAYLRYAGGWDLLGMFQFRFNYFPRN